MALAGPRHLEAAAARIGLHRVQAAGGSAEPDHLLRQIGKWEQADSMAIGLTKQRVHLVQELPIQEATVRKDQFAQQLVLKADRTASSAVASQAATPMAGRKVHQAGPVADPATAVTAEAVPDQAKAVAEGSASQELSFSSL